MAKPFARRFYDSSAWKHCRDEYVKNVSGLCEMCYKEGIIKHGDELHHIIHLTPDNINNPCITLNPDNLIYLCREHHHAIHKDETYATLLDRNRARKKKRYRIDMETGQVNSADSPPSVSKK